MKETYKRHLISASVTFLTVFGLAILADFDSLTIESFQTGAGVGILITALRAAVKAVLELFLNPAQKE